MPWHAINYWQLSFEQCVKTSQKVLSIEHYETFTLIYAQDHKVFQAKILENWPKIHEKCRNITFQFEAQRCKNETFLGLISNTVLCTWQPDSLLLSLLTNSDHSEMSFQPNKNFQLDCIPERSALKIQLRLSHQMRLWIVFEEMESAETSLLSRL